jgi:hypothetical protein
MAKAHVVPCQDWIEHESSDDCVCGPDIRFVDGGYIVVHHSLDGRERPLSAEAKELLEEED